MLWPGQIRTDGQTDGRTDARTNTEQNCNSYVSLYRKRARQQKGSHTKNSTIKLVVKLWDVPINLKVNRYAFRGSNSVIFIVASRIKRGHLIKERICSRRSKFFPLRVDPIFGRLRPPGKHTGSHENCLPLKT